MMWTGREGDYCENMMRVLEEGKECIRLRDWLRTKKNDSHEGCDGSSCCSALDGLELWA